MNALSVFSGCLGLDLGLEAVGVEAVCYVEIDQDCLKLIAVRRPGVRVVTDIHELTKGVMMVPASKITKEQFAQAVEDYKDGRSVGEIADHLPITRQALWERFKRAGVTMRPKERLGSENHFYRGGARGADWAHNKVEKAILRGDLVRPDKCENCGGPGVPYKDGRAPIQAHHDDYNKPLEVRWFCQPCHHAWHKDNEPIPLSEEVSQKEATVDVVAGGFP